MPSGLRLFIHHSPFYNFFFGLLVSTNFYSLSVLAWQSTPPFHADFDNTLMFNNTLPWRAHHQK